METEKQPQKKIPAGFFLCIGVAIGCSLGVITKNLAICAGLGISLGVMLDMIYSNKNKQK